MDRVGYVYFSGHFAGTLRETEIGYEFVYDGLYLQSGVPIGYNFPFSRNVFFSGDLFPFFENLVSEGWLLDLQSSILHIDNTDSFGLLLRNGGDLTGAVTVLMERI